jgi:hypothetical protein
MATAFAVVMIFVVSISVPVLAVVMISMTRDIFVVVPFIAYEVDRSATRVVLRAMFVPVLFMSRRDVQVDWFRCNVFRRARDHDRLRKHDRRPRDVSNINLTVEAWLADADRYAYVTGKSREAACSQQCGKQSFLHGFRSLYIDGGRHVGSHGDSGLDRIEGHRAVGFVRIVRRSLTGEGDRVGTWRQKGELVVVRRL